MERFAWKGRIKPGMQAEYKRRHDEIWPELKALLKQAGFKSAEIAADCPMSGQGRIFIRAENAPH